MKTFSTALAAHYAQQVTTFATFLEIKRRDGVFFRFTSLDVNVVLGGDTYLAAPGLDISNLEVSAGLAVDKLELSILPDDDIPEVDILTGRWDFARYRIFEADYEDPAGGINVFRRGWTGEAQTSRVGYTIELRSLKQSLQQTIVAVTSKTCRARLGDDACKVDLGPWTHTYVVTDVASRYEFTCDAATEVDDYYGDGIAHAEDGENAGYPDQKIKSFAAGVFVLALPMAFPIQVGDSLTFIAGCRKRLIEDCKNKYDNVLNNQSEPHLPGPDLLLADPEVST